MEWKPEHSLGIKEIDDQHKKLLTLFSAIEVSAKLQQSTWQDVLYGIVALRGIAKSHFEFEEGLMRLFGYTEIAEHEKSHRYFFTRLDEIAGKPHHEAATHELIVFLGDWFNDHILGDDKRYAEYISAGASIVRSN